MKIAIFPAPCRFWLKLMVSSLVVLLGLGSGHQRVLATLDFLGSQVASANVLLAAPLLPMGLGLE